ncbi:MAG: hypothetical protein KY475_24465 [Planctomycetes bacterium]|nr:hypothetical protein [Planctomycetota bacterium]
MSISFFLRGDPVLPPIHPICRLFPMLSDAELEGMAEDIRRRGKLLEPIVLLEGAVLDGRNRLEACRRAGVQPTFVEWEGEGSPLEWAITKNLRRRQLNASQRAVLVLQVLPLLEWEARERQRLHTSPPSSKVAQKCATLLLGGGDERGKAAEHAARLVGASPRYIQAAKRIQSTCPELLPHVTLGKINMIDAQMAVNLSPDIRSRVLKELSHAPPGLAVEARRTIRDHGGIMPTYDKTEYRILVRNDHLRALDEGEEITIKLGDRACLLRLAEPPQEKEASTSRDLVPMNSWSDRLAPMRRPR